jgi:Tfp pilus assembly protein PilF
MKPTSRPTILMGILLVLVLAYVGKSYQSAQSTYHPEPLLAGRNSVSNLVVSKDESGMWQAGFDYFFTGGPFAHATVAAEQDDASVHPPGRLAGSFVVMERGAHHVSVRVPYPGKQETTTRVVARMVEPSGATETTIASVQTEQRIEWPDYQRWNSDLQFASRTPQQNLDLAISIIDEGRNVEAAAEILEKLVQINPSFEQAYIELARVAMKSNWGPDGLHQAEGLLNTVLQRNSQNVNAKILQGYVYAHEEQFSQAEKMFASIDSASTSNLWLWANWGELLAMQGKFDQAAAKYREVINRPMTHNTYDRARVDAYTHLVKLLERHKDLDGIEKLYKQQIAEFGSGACYSSDYGRFLLHERDDPEAAIEIARSALNLDCNDAPARQTLGLAEYVVWSKSTGTARLEAMNQARIYLPPGSEAIYLLAGDERGVKIISQLLADGEKVDQKDNENMTALARAVEANEKATARRLLRLGAKPGVEIGVAKIPVALLPVMSRELEMVQLMQEFGADYTSIKYQGMTAVDVAKRTADTQLLEALKPHGKIL